MLRRAALAAFLMTYAAASAALPPLQPRGVHMVDPKGNVVQLNGTNLGNWLVLEMWMLNQDEAPNPVPDQFTLESVLRERFGEAEAERLMDVYRASWITERDFKLIRSFGFNVVRLPMNYRLMEDDARPFVLRKDAWEWIDRAVDAAEKHGMYTILDMHGAQGGQSVYDHTGHSGQNKLWTVPENQKRLAWLWGELAKRYRNRPAVVAYDVFNEPFGGTHAQQKAVFELAYREIRKHDRDKLVYAHGHYDGFAHYGDPKANGWRNVGFQMHYYPGLFGNGEPTLLTHAKHLQGLAFVDEEVRKVNVPFLVGEMNVVFKRAGGGAMMRRTYDLHAKYGWATTMWAYKASSRDGGIGEATWGMVTNAKPARLIDFRNASKAEIEAWMRGFATDELVVYEELRDMLTAKNPTLPPLPEVPEPIRAVPHQDSVPDYRVSDVGGALKGGLRSQGDRAFDLYGGGNDIWGGQDQFRFLHRTVEGDFTLEVTLESLLEVDNYSKAGLMVRASLDPTAAAVLLSSFPSGGLQLAVRDRDGGSMGGRAVGATMPGLRLRLQRIGNLITTSWRSGDGEWRELGKVDLPNLPRRVEVGAVALSHDNRQLTRVRYRDLEMRLPR